MPHPTSLDRPFNIGTVRLANRLLLAPLAGYSDLPFRLLCRQNGAGFCVSEMISSHGLVYQQAKTVSMLKSCPQERPVSFQLFGSDPDIMGEAAAHLDNRTVDVIDINMGCPVRKVTKRGAGAALMTDIRRAEDIITAVVRNCTVPVTVKIRSGPDSAHIIADEFGRMIQASGGAAVCIHGRTWKQGFSGHADWDVVARVKRILTIPVIGNGDVFSYADGLAKQQYSGCDGIMIGRAAMGNPWVFSQSGKPVHAADIAALALQHLKLLETYNADPHRCLAAIKNHLGKYFKGYPGAAKMRTRVYTFSDWSSLKDYLALSCQAESTP